MDSKEKIKQILEERILVIDGATGTQIQNLDIPKEAWLDENGVDQEGCNELLNATAPHLMQEVHNAYAKAGADLIKTNTFGAMPWVLDEYGLGNRAYELAKKGAEIVKEICDKYSTPEQPRFVLGSIGPGT
ncbi:MAG: homocysteine S-methyltransferase family protein, partial [Sulfurovaceae bacterium]|nr:homocysteine S-methyltransferase family protein [Sulfurovaceae bacterium]